MATSVVLILLLSFFVDEIFSNGLPPNESCPHRRFISFHTCITCRSPQEVAENIDILEHDAQFLDWLRDDCGMANSNRYTFYVPDRDLVSDDYVYNTATRRCSYGKNQKRYKCYKDAQNNWDCVDHGEARGEHSAETGHLFCN